LFTVYDNPVRIESDVNEKLAVPFGETAWVNGVTDVIVKK
jgi:hypothetical protein